jgi:hypothetical protein
VNPPDKRQADAIKHVLLNLAFDYLVVNPATTYNVWNDQDLVQEYIDPPTPPPP